MNINEHDYYFVKADVVKTVESKNEIFYDIEVEDDNTFYIKTKNNEKLLLHNCDGYHIKGLLINFFDVYFPELLKKEFIYEFITPILRIKKGNRTKYFYKIKDFEKYKETNGIDGYTIKYFKGLGSIDKEMIGDIFKDIDKHLIKIKYTNPEITENLIDLAFRKNRANDRKEWMSNYQINNNFDKLSQVTTFESFMNNEFIEFSISDVIRSVPSLMDGLKPSQRKVLFTLFNNNFKKEINVGELFGYVKSKAEYHHGPASLEECIISMAHDFVGSNNLSFLKPNGNFGTRLNGGKDAAAARYIYTELNNLTRIIFNSEDDKFLDYLNVDGKYVEPEYYIPSIPTILLNGATGIGTGYSTTIPKYNINDLIIYLENKLNKKRKNIELTPYYNNFKGTVYYDKENDNCITIGVINQIDENTLKVTELPINVWNDDYYLILDKMVDDKIIKNYIKECDDENVNITIKINKENFNYDNLNEFFQLTSKINMSNMYLFDINGKIKKYNTVYDIIDEFYDNRLPFYSKRKEYILNNLINDKNKLDNIFNFIKLVVENKIKINNNSLDNIYKLIENYKIQKIENSYSYLLNMSIIKLTEEEMINIENKINNINTEIKNIESKTIEDMWKEDLSVLKREYKKIYKNENS